MSLEIQLWSLQFSLPLYLTFIKMDIFPKKDTQYCRDANLWRSKIWDDSLFFTTPNGFPNKFNKLTFNKLTQPPMGMTYDIIWSLTRTTYYQNLQSSFWCLKQSLSATKYVQKCPRNRTANKKNSSFELKMGYIVNLKLRHRKAQKMSLSGRYGYPYRRAGDRWCCIRESWHVWYWSQTFPLITSWL